MPLPNGDFTMRKAKNVVTSIAYYKAKAARAERELQKLKQANEARDTQLETLINDFSERFDGGKLYFGFGVHNLYTVLNSICYEHGRGQLSYPGTTDGSKPEGFVWIRTVTITDEEIRVLRIVGKRYGDVLKPYSADEALAKNIAQKYGLIEYWHNPYKHASHFGLSKDGRELFAGDSFQRYIKSLDEKQVAVEPEGSNA
jgi:hypothetical protein